MLHSWILPLVHVPWKSHDFRLDWIVYHFPYLQLYPKHAIQSCHIDPFVLSDNASVYLDVKLESKISTTPLWQLNLSRKDQEKFSSIQNVVTSLPSQNINIFPIRVIVWDLNPIWYVGLIPVPGNTALFKEMQTHTDVSTFKSSMASGFIHHFKNCFSLSHSHTPKQYLERHYILACVTP